SGHGRNPLARALTSIRAAFNTPGEREAGGRAHEKRSVSSRLRERRTRPRLRGGGFFPRSENSREAGELLDGEGLGAPLGVDLRLREGRRERLGRGDPPRAQGIA